MHERTNAAHAPHAAQMESGRSQPQLPRPRPSSSPPPEWPPSSLPPSSPPPSSPPPSSPPLPPTTTTRTRTAAAAAATSATSATATATSAAASVATAAATTTTTKRPRGRPKGSKNGPNAGKNGRPVGRPKKDAWPSARPSDTDDAHTSRDSRVQHMHALEPSTRTGMGTPPTDQARPCGTSPMAATVLTTSATRVPPECHRQDHRRAAPSCAEDRDTRGPTDGPDRAHSAHPVRSGPGPNTPDHGESEGGGQLDPSDAALAQPHEVAPVLVRQPAVEVCQNLDPCAAEGVPLRLWHESQDGADLSWDPHLNPLADDVESDVDEDDADATFDASAEAEGDAIDTDAGVRGSGGPASQGKPRSALPRWLKQSYSSVCQELRNGMVKNARGMLVPKCYAQGSFFFSEENRFLALDGRRQLSPTMFYEPRYFVWLPHVFARIPCPSCNNSSAFLSPHSMARSPRRAVDIDRVVYIIGQRYRCLKCGRSFQGWSKPVLDVLPPALSAQFPFHLTHRGGLSDALVALLRSCFQRGIGPSPFAEMIRSFHQRTYEKTYLQYLEMYGELRAMALTMTKGHEQVMPALAEIPASLCKYGHRDIELVFTDNVRGDKRELERTLPSLLRDVQPVTHSDLKPLTITTDWEISVLRSRYQVDNLLNTFLEDVAALPSESSRAIAMDMEWSVNRQTGVHSLVSVVTIAFDKKIWVVQVSFAHKHA
ncbi:hypothetical protein BC826DRAFT_1140742 [Russula brevipes]|nr:hypothetical protein BC826DRAFT_1140742 [Russula brevipes]